MAGLWPRGLNRQYLDDAKQLSNGRRNSITYAHSDLSGIYQIDIKKI
jgi:hypothetical protein